MNGVATVLSDMTIEEAAEILAARRVDAAPVLDGDGVAIGVVTVFDLLAFLAAGGGARRLSPHESASPDELTDVERLRKTAITEVMTAPIPAVDRASEAVKAMCERGLGRVFVLRAGRPVGVITALDALRILAPREVSHGPHRHPVGPVSSGGRLRGRLPAARRRAARRRRRRAHDAKRGA